MKKWRGGALPVFGLLGLILVSLHLMSSAVQNTEELSRLFVPLLVVSMLGLFALLILIGTNIGQLLLDYRRRAPGSRLTLRMVVVFVVLSLAPVSIVYYYSQQYLLQGIESWFDVQIDQAMEDALDLSRASLDLHKRQRLKSTQWLLSELTGTSVAGLSLSLGDMREKFGASELSLFDGNGAAVAMSNVEPTILVPSQPDASILQQVRGGNDFVGLDPRGEGAQLEVQVVVSDAERGFYLQAFYPTSTSIADLTEMVQGAYNRYKELAYLRSSLKSTFTLALALVLLFSLLAAIWAAFFSARRLVAPITDIAEATRAVAKGDYDMQLPLPRVRDELGFLAASFNDMTRRIAQARDEASASQRLVEAQRAYLEIVLGRLSSGVMAFDAAGRIQTANKAAHDILKVDLDRFLGLPLDALSEESTQLKQFVEAIREPTSLEMREWREEVKLFGGQGRQVLLCRGTPLAQPDDKSVGYALVFDDITTLIKAQRDAAWGEVARRLAHEIKNPLTPIQLSAERLRHKYLHKMPSEDAQVLDRATHTIVQQVEAMKEMVNAFSDYARPPGINSRPVVVEEIISEVLDLYSSAGLQLEFQVDLGAADARIEADPVRLRQVVHNLVKNAIEAVTASDSPRIEVRTCVLSQGECDFVELRVSDNGPGFNDDTLSHLFEPYVTTKKKGTGLGLAIVKKIAEEHGGLVWAENRPVAGADVILRLPLIQQGQIQADRQQRVVVEETV